MHFSTGKDDWATPQWLFDELDKEFNFLVDVCASRLNRKCPLYITEKDDAFSWSWANLFPENKQVCWMNPPHSQLAKWIQKASEESKKGATVVCLLPARTDTIAFHTYIWDTDKHRPRPGVEVRFLKGRLKFVGAKSSAPFPSMIVIFRGCKND